MRRSLRLVSIPTGFKKLRLIPLLAFHNSISSSFHCACFCRGESRIFIVKGRGNREGTEVRMTGSGTKRREGGGRGRQYEESPGAWPAWQYKLIVEIMYLLTFFSCINKGKRGKGLQFSQTTEAWLMSHPIERGKNTSSAFRAPVNFPIQTN